MITLPVEFPPYLTALLSLALVIHLVRHLSMPGARDVLIFMTAVTVWSFGYARELAATNLADKLLWAKIQYIGIVVVPVAWLIFTLKYSNRRRWLSLPSRLTLAVIPAATVLLVWTNETHHLIWTHTTVVEQGPLSLLHVEYGFWFWIHITYAYALLLLGTLLVFLVMVRSHYPYREQAASLLVGALFPWASNAIYILGVGPIRNLDLTPIAFLITGTVTTWALVRFRLLDVVPVARHRLIEDMEDAVLVLDGLGRVVELNPAAQHLLGETERSAIGRAADEMLAHWPQLTRLLTGSETARTEVTVNDDDTPQFYDVRISSLHSPSRPRMGKLVVLRDISQLKRREEDLREAARKSEAAGQALATANRQLAEVDQIKSRFISDISHELRTPLSNVKMYLYLIRHGAPKRHGEYLDVLEVEYQRLQQVVDAILEFAQIEIDAQQWVDHAVDVNSAVQAAVSIYEREAAHAGISLGFTPDAHEPVVQGIGRLLTAAIGYLIDNALAYTEKGEIWVSITTEGGGEEVRIRVQDTGSGIEPGDLPYLFHHFYRSEHADESNRQGTGLGLAIVKRIVDQHRGRVEVHSEPDVGSQFDVFLPATRQLPSGNPAPSPPNG